MKDTPKPHRFLCFATPIWLFPDEGRIDRDALEKSIKAEQTSDPEGVRISNIGGWQSASKLYLEEPFRELADHIREKAKLAARDWGFDFGGYAPTLNTLWANINRGPQINELHNHWGFALQNFNLISGAYYVKCNEKSGAIKFVDERPSSKFITDSSLPFVPNPTNAIGASFVIKPRPGDLVMFPAWLEHKVDGSEDEEERISMSFNLSMPDELVDKILEERRAGNAEEKDEAD